VNEHLTRLEILEYLEDAEYADRDNAESHLLMCAECRSVLDELQQLVLLLADGSILRHLDDGTHEQLGVWEDLMREDERAGREARAAESIFSSHAAETPESWERFLAEHPEVCTNALVDRLVTAAGLELDRKPERALDFLSVAELVAHALDDVAARRALGHVWKQRSNALRMLARYDDAIDAAIMAENFYSSLPTPDASFEVGQARYTMAVTLFKMTRYAAALQALASSRAVLEPYGTSAPLAKTIMLDAVIRIEQGDVTTARDTLREVLPIVEALGDSLDAARVRANLAECNLRLGELEGALADARAAVEQFRTLGNVAEETRSEWTMAMIRLAQGEAEELDRLHEIAAVYEELGMLGDAGFVNLDIVEELLRREEWTEAAAIARDLVTLFTNAGVTLASVNALNHLRQAVVNREATEAMIRYVREYISSDDAKRPFEPPGADVN
jgi:tetratricopeptide (TPR) repeat protein